VLQASDPHQVALGQAVALAHRRDLLCAAAVHHCVWGLGNHDHALALEPESSERVLRQRLRRHDHAHRALDR
jgi:hypothetical protein